MFEENNRTEEVMEEGTNEVEEQVEATHLEENKENIEQNQSETIDETTEEANDTKLIELTEKISELETQLEEKENRYLRLQADFDNFRRRSRLDFEAAQKYRAQDLVTELLPVLDNFERALSMETENEQVKTFMQGMEMIYRNLLDALKKEGLEPIEAVGKPFDPQFHQAVMMVQEEGFESNVVVDEFQKGYLLKDRVIRPSMVKVNQ